MATKPTATPVPLARPVQLQQAAIKSESFGKVGNVQKSPSKSEQAFSTLNKIVPEAAREATSILNERAEEDATRQEVRALNNMEPSEDATKLGRTAHRMVNVRNRTNEMMVELNDEAATFIGSREDWEDHVALKQEELFRDTGVSEDALKVTGEIFREQLPKAQLIKFRADQERDQQAKYLTAKTSFKGAVTSEFTPEEQLKNFGQVMQESVDLGMSQSAVQKSLIDAAVEGAANNDLTLIDMTKAIGLYEEVPALQKAYKSAETRIDREEQSTIAVMKENLATELSVSPSMSFEQFAAKANSQRNSAGEILWTETQIRAEYNKQSARHDKKYNLDLLFGRSLKTEPIGDGSVVDIDALSGADKEKMVEMYNQLYAGKLEQAQATATDEASLDETTRQLLVEKGTWLQGMGLSDKQWTKDFKHLEDLPLSAIREMPDDLFDSILATIGRGDQLESVPDVLSSHASANQQALMLNFKDNHRLGMTEKQALISAKEQVAATPVPLTGDDYKEFYSKVKSSVDSSFTAYFDGKDDIPESEMTRASSAIESRAKVWYNVLKDQDKAIARATAEFQATNHQLSDGRLVNGNLTLIAAKMNVPNNHEAVDKILTTLSGRMDALADVEGYEDYLMNTQTPHEEWTMELNKDGMIIFRDEYNAEVTKPILLHEAANFSIEQMAEKRAADKASRNSRRLRSQKSSSKKSSSALGDWLPKNKTRQLNNK